MASKQTLGDSHHTPQGPLSRNALTGYYKKYVRARRQEECIAPRRAAKDGLRIASYNIHFHSPYFEEAGEGHSHTKRVIDEELSADIVCLQECVNVSKACGYPYSHFHRVGNAICSKLPLQDCASYLYNAQRYDTRGICAATVEHPTVGRIRIFNTHLDAFDDTDELRFRQAAEIEDIIRRDREMFKCGDIPALLMGDFNALHRASYVDELHWKWIVQQDLSRQVTSKTLAMDTIIHDRGWFDLFAKEAPTVTTWSMRRIDYILARVDQDFAARFRWSSWVHHTVASDHLPVGVDVELLPE
jgi:endonuclease/exonuclease/phosphatase family metal-dependent hydrolase